jgi:hypothetical protein
MSIFTNSFILLPFSHLLALINISRDQDSWSKLEKQTQSCSFVAILKKQSQFRVTLGRMGYLPSAQEIAAASTGRLTALRASQ